MYRGGLRMTRLPRDTTPPAFLRLAGNRLRWQILQELARSDRRVRELSDALGRPQNVVSYHLARLRAEALVSARRSSADGRDTYQCLDLGRCRHLLDEAGAALHPGLAGGDPVAARPRAGTTVLFLCTGNSARSQMAEAFVNASDTGVRASSAGSHPKALHPNAVRVMGELGVDIAGHRSKHLDEFAGQRFDHVVTLCDRVREVCPEFPEHPCLAHWSIPDPSLEGATDRETYPAFERSARELSDRVRFFLHALELEPATTEVN